MKKWRRPQKRPLGKSIASLNGDGSKFYETEEFRELECLRGQLSALLGCFVELNIWFVEAREQIKDCYPTSLDSFASNLVSVQKFTILSKQEIVLCHLFSAYRILKETSSLLESAEFSEHGINKDQLDGVRLLTKILFAAANMINEGATLTRLAGETAQLNGKNWMGYEEQLGRKS